MRKLLFLLFLLIATQANTAELLVKVKPSKLYFPEGYETGDIMVVRKDGFVWGNKEVYPEFVLIKIPDYPVEKLKKFEDKLEHINGEEITNKKQRKYCLTDELMQLAVDNGGTYELVVTLDDKKFKMKKYIQKRKLNESGELSAEKDSITDADIQ